MAQILLDHIRKFVSPTPELEAQIPGYFELIRSQKKEILQPANRV